MHKLEEDVWLVMFQEFSRSLHSVENCLGKKSCKRKSFETVITEVFTIQSTKLLHFANFLLSSSPATTSESNKKPFIIFPYFQNCTIQRVHCEITYALSMDLLYYYVRLAKNRNVGQFLIVELINRTTMCLLLLLLPT